MNHRANFIETQNLSKIFKLNGYELNALKNINLHIAKGEFIALMGPSGSGKSTLLNILGLLDPPTSGNYFFKGEDVSRYSEKQILETRKNNIGFVFQNFNLIDEITVFENIELPLVYKGLPATHRKVKVEQIMEKLKISHKAELYPYQLSGGYQQKVAIARALITSPQIILADEPTGNLDSENGENIMKLLSSLNKAGATIILATHSPKDAEYCNRILHLLDGRIVGQNFGKDYYNGFITKKHKEG